MTKHSKDPIARLLEGHERFRQRYFKDEPELFVALATQGQAPAIAVVACCDSRVDPAIVMDCEPGDLFIIRNVANLVPPYMPDHQYHGTSAALEFAVCNLNVGHLIVLGHAQCGGVQALLEGAGTGSGEQDFISAWMRIAAEARDEALRLPDTASQLRARCGEQAAVRISLINLMTFPWIRTRVTQGSLRLHGWYFDIQNGALAQYDDASGRFLAIID